MIFMQCSRNYKKNNKFPTQEVNEENRLEISYCKMGEIYYTILQNGF